MTVVFDWVSMELFGLNAYLGLLDHVLSYLGSGCEFPLASTCSEALAIVSQRTSWASDKSVVYLLADVGRMSVPELEGALIQRGISQSGTKAQLEARLTLTVRASGLPRRSVWYYLSTTNLCNYARNSLGLMAGKTGSDQSKLMDKAAGGGQLLAVQMLRRFDPPCPWHAQTCIWAAQEGHIEVLKWLRQPGKPEGQCPWDAIASWHAAKAGQLEVLQWLRLSGKPEGVCPWNAYACMDAAKGGHLKVLRWLRLPGKPEGVCPWGVLTCQYAADGGQLEVLKWLRLPGKPEGQCPWDAGTCRLAAQRGHLEMLQWLRRPGHPEGVCPWDAVTCTYAAMGGHLEVLQWLRSGEDPCPWNKGACLHLASSVETKQWILTQD